MALRRYGNKRDDDEPEIIEALEQAFCSVYTLDTPMDLLVGRMTPEGPRTFLLEVKKPGVGRLTKDQQEFIKGWRGHFAVVTCVQEALEAVGIKT